MKKVFAGVAFLSIAVILFSIAGCKGTKKNSDNLITVNARSMSDPDMLNPLNLSSADGRYIANLLFVSMLGTDPDNYLLTPVLAVARPTITEVMEGPYAGNIRL